MVINDFFPKMPEIRDLFLLNLNSIDLEHAKVVSKIWLSCVCEFRIRLALDYKDLTVGEIKIFDEKSISLLQDNQLTLKQKMIILKNSINKDCSRPRCELLLINIAAKNPINHVALSLLLKLGADLNLIKRFPDASLLYPTPLFSCWDGKNLNEKALDELIKAGTDWRIENCNDEKCFLSLKEWTDEKYHKALQNAEVFAKKYWKQLGRENESIPQTVCSVFNDY